MHAVALRCFGLTKMSLIRHIWTTVVISMSTEYRDRDYIRSVVVNPDIVADFRNMPFANDTFDLVIFDPPHLIKAGDHSWLKMKYGVLPEEDWQDYIKKGFDECMRVLKPTGILLFKWSNNQIKFNQVFKAIGRKLIMGDRRGSTRWSVFIKEN